MIAILIYLGAGNKQKIRSKSYIYLYFISRQAFIDHKTFKDDKYGAEFSKPNNFK